MLVAWMGVGFGGGGGGVLGADRCGILPDMGDIWFLRSSTLTLKRVSFRPLVVSVPGQYPLVGFLICIS